MQPTLKRFFQPGAPDALKPALSVSEVKKSVGRQLTPRMAEIYKEVMGEAAEAALKKMKLDTPAASPPASSPPASPLSSAAVSQEVCSPTSSKDSVVRALSFELTSPEAEKQLVASADKVRRKGGRPAGKKNYQRRLLEMPLAAKMKIARELSAAVEQHADSKSFWKEMRRKFGLDTRSLKKIIAEKDDLTSLVQSRSLTSDPLRTSCGKAFLKSARQSRYKGFRKPGAGRKARWPDLPENLKTWCEEQRSYCHELTREILLDKYLVLLQEKEASLKHESEVAVDPLQKAALLKLEKEAAEEGKNLLAKKSARDSKKTRLAELCELKALRPDLTTKLSQQEEYVRSVLTWQSFDRTIWKACFAPLAELEESVADAEGFRKNVKSMIVLFSDQVPLWVKKGSEKQLFARFESKPVSQQTLRAELEEHHKKVLNDPARGSEMVPLDMPLKQQPGSGQRQKRSLQEPSADRYRLTYEARQVVYNLCSGQPLRAEVLPGLLVLHGTHARLSNISSSGTWVEDEQFWWKGKLVKRRAGESAGRILWPYRELRKLKPLLVQKVSIMQQPAGNVDSILFHWSQLELSKLAPCAVHQRDCFSASWSPSAAQSLFTTQTLQCVICPKMTASLQLTDTDFSRSFKSLCRETMGTLRRAGQQALLESGNREVWKASVEDCITAVVAAQSEMSLRQTQKNWILAGLRRNGMLAYRPDLESGELKPLQDDPVADFPQGSARFPSAWPKDRFSWVTKEESGKLVPVEPDWSLIPGSKEISDLVEYQFWNPEESKDSSEEEALLKLDELPESLQWPCVQSGLLQIPLSLQKAAWKLDSATSEKVKAKKVQRKLAKDLKARARQALKGQFRKRVSAQLKVMSLKQAARGLTPMAGVSAAKGRKSVKAGPGKKVRQALKKGLKKKATEKVLKDLQEEAAEAPPLPPPEGPPPELDDAEAAASALPEASGGPLLGRKLRVLPLGYLCGKEGLCQAHNICTGAVTLTVGEKLQKVILQEAEVAAVLPAWLKPCKWKNQLLSRDLKQKILSACGGLTHWMEEADFLAPEPIELLDASKPKMLLDSHILFGWELLRWHFSTPSADFFLAKGYLLLDPVLSGNWLLQGAAGVGVAVAPKEALEKEMHRVWNAASALFCPIFCENHWSLLILKKGEGSAEQPVLTYFDSMDINSEHAVKNGAAAEKVLKFLLQDDQACLPPPSESQQQESDDCGFWTLAFCLQVLAFWRGEGPRSRGQDKICVMDLKSQMATWLKVLKTEQTKYQAELDKRMSKLEAERASLEKKAKALAKTVADTAAAASEAAKLADLVHNKNHMPELSDLPKSSKLAIEKIKSDGDPGICSRCRFSSGCLSCSVGKAERYYLNLLRHSLGLAKLCAKLSFSCSLYCFAHFLHTLQQNGCPLAALSGDWLQSTALWCSSLVQLSGAALWCSSLVQPGGAAFWCSLLVQPSGAAFWCSLLVQLCALCSLLLHCCVSLFLHRFNLFHLLSYRCNSDTSGV